MSEILPRFESEIEVREAIQDAQDGVSRKAVIVKAAKQAKLPTPLINEKVVEKVLAEYRVLELVEAGQQQGWIADAGRKSPDSGELTFPDLGLSDQRLAETRKIRRNWTRERLDEQARELAVTDELLSWSSLTYSPEYVTRRSNESSEWFTPPYVIEAARRVLGEIDLDPASCEEANATVQAAEFFTEDDDGLAQPWYGRVWLNPPYQGKAGEFATKLAQSYQAGEIEAGILLITALTTDTKWFRALWNGVLCFTYGRIQFDGRGGKSNTAGSALVYFGSEEQHFAEEFAFLGAVVRRWP